MLWIYVLMIGYKVGGNVLIINLWLLVMKMVIGNESVNFI